MDSLFVCIFLLSLATAALVSLAEYIDRGNAPDNFIVDWWTPDVLTDDRLEFAPGGPVHLDCRTLLTGDK